MAKKLIIRREQKREWCEDDWHENYEGAPNDGSAWRSGDNSIKVIRGGSWDYIRANASKFCKPYVARLSNFSYKSK